MRCCWRWRSGELNRALRKRDGTAQLLQLVSGDLGERHRSVFNSKLVRQVVGRMLKLPLRRPAVSLELLRMS